MKERQEAQKSLTLRLDQLLFERLRAVAEVEGEAVSDVIRQAIAKYVEQRRQDPLFQQLLEENLARHQRLLKLLSEG